MLETDGGEEELRTGSDNGRGPGDFGDSYFSGSEVSSWIQRARVQSTSDQG